MRLATSMTSGAKGNTKIKGECTTLSAGLVCVPLHITMTDDEIRAVIEEELRAVLTTEGWGAHCMVDTVTGQRWYSRDHPDMASFRRASGGVGGAGSIFCSGHNYTSVYDGQLVCKTARALAEIVAASICMHGFVSFAAYGGDTHQIFVSTWFVHAAPSHAGPSSVGETQNEADAHALLAMNAMLEAAISAPMEP